MAASHSCSPSLHPLLWRLVECFQKAKQFVYKGFLCTMGLDVWRVFLFPLTPNILLNWLFDMERLEEWYRWKVCTKASQQKWSSWCLVYLRQLTLSSHRSLRGASDKIGQTQCDNCEIWNPYIIMKKCTLVSKDKTKKDVPNYSRTTLQMLHTRHVWLFSFRLTEVCPPPLITVRENNSTS